MKADISASILLFLLSFYSVVVGASRQYNSCKEMVDTKCFPRVKVGCLHPYILIISEGSGLKRNSYHLILPCGSAFSSSELVDATI